MPLYPQYSAATSGSSINEWQNICKKNNFEVKTSTLCCYPTDDNFIQAHKDEIVKILIDGSSRAQEIANEVLIDIKKIIGFNFKD